MKKLILLVAAVIVIAMVVITATATPINSPDAPDHITFQWRSDSILMRWLDGPANAANYRGSLCIQKIQPFSPTTTCVWDLFGRYTTENNVWFIIPYPFTPGTYRINSGTVAAYDSLGHVIASQSFTTSAEWTYYYKDYLPFVKKPGTTPYP